MRSVSATRPSVFVSREDETPASPFGHFEVSDESHDDSKTRIVPIKDHITLVGREPACEIRIHDARVSRQHCKIVAASNSNGNTELRVFCIKERSKVIVDGENVSVEGKIIRDGSVIRVLNTALRWHAQENLVSSSTPPPQGNAADDDREVFKTPGLIGTPARQRMSIAGRTNPDVSTPQTNGRPRRLQSMEMSSISLCDSTRATFGSANSSFDRAYNLTNPSDSENTSFESFDEDDSEDVATMQLVGDSITAKNPPEVNNVDKSLFQTPSPAVTTTRQSTGIRKTNAEGDKNQSVTDDLGVSAVASLFETPKMFQQKQSSTEQNSTLTNTIEEIKVVKSNINDEVFKTPSATPIRQSTRIIKQDVAENASVPNQHDISIPGNFFETPKAVEPIESKTQRPLTPAKKTEESKVAKPNINDEVFKTPSGTPTRQSTRIIKQDVATNASVPNEHDVSIPGTFFETPKSLPQKQSSAEQNSTLTNTTEENKVAKSNINDEVFKTPSATPTRQSTRIINQDAAANASVPNQHDISIPCTFFETSKAEEPKENKTQRPLTPAKKTEDSKGPSPKSKEKVEDIQALATKKEAASPAVTTPRKSTGIRKTKAEGDKDQQSVTDDLGVSGVASLFETPKSLLQKQSSAEQNSTLTNTTEENKVAKSNLNHEVVKTPSATPTRQSTRIIKQDVATNQHDVSIPGTFFETPKVVEPKENKTQRSLTPAKKSEENNFANINEEVFRTPSATPIRQSTRIIKKDEAASVPNQHDVSIPGNFFETPKAMEPKENKTQQTLTPAKKTEESKIAKFNINQEVFKTPSATPTRQSTRITKQDAAATASVPNQHDVSIPGTFFETPKAVERTRQSTRIVKQDLAANVNVPNEHDVSIPGTFFETPKAVEPKGNKSPRPSTPAKKTEEIKSPSPKSKEKVEDIQAVATMKAAAVQEESTEETVEEVPDHQPTPGTKIDGKLPKATALMQLVGDSITAKNPPEVNNVDKSLSQTPSPAVTTTRQSTRSRKTKHEGDKDESVTDDLGVSVVASLFETPKSLQQKQSSTELNSTEENKVVKSNVNHEVVKMSSATPTRQSTRTIKQNVATNASVPNEHDVSIPGNFFETPKAVEPKENKTQRLLTPAKKTEENQFAKSNINDEVFKTPSATPTRQSTRIIKQDVAATASVLNQHDVSIPGTFFETPKSLQQKQSSTELNSTLTNTTEGNKVAKSNINHEVVKTPSATPTRQSTRAIKQNVATNQHDVSIPGTFFETPKVVEPKENKTQRPLTPAKKTEENKFAKSNINDEVFKTPSGTPTRQSTRIIKQNVATNASVRHQHDVSIPGTFFETPKIVEPKESKTQLPLTPAEMTEESKSPSPKSKEKVEDIQAVATKKAAAVKEESSEETEGEVQPSPVKKRGRPAVATKKVEAAKEESTEETDAEVGPSPVKKRGRQAVGTKKVEVAKEESSEETDAEVEPSPVKKRGRPAVATKKVEEAAQGESTEETDGETQPPPVKKRGGKAVATKKAAGAEDESTEDKVPDHQPTPVTKRGGKAVATKKAAGAQEESTEETEEEVPDHQPTPVIKRGGKVPKAKPTLMTERGAKALAAAQDEETEKEQVQEANSRATRRANPVVPPPKKAIARRGRNVAEKKEEPVQDEKPVPARSTRRAAKTLPEEEEGVIVERPSTSTKKTEESKNPSRKMKSKESDVQTPSSTLKKTRQPSTLEDSSAEEVKRTRQSSTLQDSSAEEVKRTRQSSTLKDSSAEEEPKSTGKKRGGRPRKVVPVKKEKLEEPVPVESTEDAEEYVSDHNPTPVTRRGRKVPEPKPTPVKKRGRQAVATKKAEVAQEESTEETEEEVQPTPVKKRGRHAVATKKAAVALGESTEETTEEVQPTPVTRRGGKADATKKAASAQGESTEETDAEVQPTPATKRGRKVPESKPTPVTRRGGKAVATKKATVAQEESMEETEEEVQPTPVKKRGRQAVATKKVDAPQEESTEETAEEVQPTPVAKRGRKAVAKKTAAVAQEESTEETEEEVQPPPLKKRGRQAVGTKKAAVAQEDSLEETEEEPDHQPIPATRRGRKVPKANPTLKAKRGEKAVATKKAAAAAQEESSEESEDEAEVVQKSASRVTRNAKPVVKLPTKVVARKGKNVAGIKEEPVKEEEPVLTRTTRRTAKK